MELLIICFGFAILLFKFLIFLAVVGIVFCLICEFLWPLLKVIGYGLLIVFIFSVLCIGIYMIGTLLT